MATGLLSRTYRPEEARIDVGYLAERGGGRYVEGRVGEIRPAERTIVLAGGERLRYDAMSACLGSGTSNGGFAAPGEGRFFPVKPVENVERLRGELLSLAENGRRPRVAVIGGGPAGCEMAANAKALLEERGVGGEVVVADSGGRCSGRRRGGRSGRSKASYARGAWG